MTVLAKEQKCNITGYFLVLRIHLQNLPDENGGIEKTFKYILSLNSTNGSQEIFLEDTDQGYKELE